jgi:hypothetical protein
MSFTYRKSCTIQTGQVPSTQTSFPALLPFIAADNDFRTVANGGQNQSASGYDIRPYSNLQLSTALTFELVPGSYDASQGSFEMWVNMTAQDGAVVYVGHGDSGITTDGSSTSTWPSKYKIVAHYPDGSSLTVNDSTSNARNGTKNGSPSAVAGKIDGGIQWTTTADYISYGTAAIPTTGSHSVWFYPTWNYNDFLYHEIGMQAATPTKGFYGEKDGFSNFTFGWFPPGSGFVQASASGMVKNAWNHIMLTWDPAIPQSILYLNGTQIGTDSHNGTFDTTGLTVKHGYESNRPTPTVSGDRTDEFRLLDAVLTPDWITTEYRNQNDLSAFWTKGTDTLTISNGTLASTPSASCAWIGSSVGSGVFSFTPNAVCSWVGLSGNSLVSTPTATCAFTGKSTAAGVFASTPSSTSTWLIGYVNGTLVSTPTATVSFIGKANANIPLVVIPSIVTIFDALALHNGTFVATPHVNTVFTGFQTDLNTYLRRYLDDI